MHLDPVRAGIEDFLGEPKRLLYVPIVFNHKAQKKGRRKPYHSAALNDALRIDAPESASAPRWTRTNNLLIKSQLLCQLS